MIIIAIILLYLFGVAFAIFINTKKKVFSKWTALLHILWVMLFLTTLLYEFFLYSFHDQMITSSGDATYRYYGVSILIGYAIVVMCYMLSLRYFKQQRSVLINWLLLICSVCIVIENQHCIVIGYSGNRFVEFYTPFYEAEHIGCLTADYAEPNKPLTNYPFINKNITKVYTKDNSIIFERPFLYDYKVTKQLLFWRFDFPDEF
ncbi:MAG: hypothetical protein V4677_17630 [Bacteroidota bacterium]